METLPWVQLLPCTFTGEQSPGEVCTYKRAPRAALQPPTPHAAYQHLWPTQTAAALPQDRDELSPGEDPTQCPRLGGLGNGVTRTRCCQYPLRSNPDPSTPQTAPAAPRGAAKPQQRLRGGWLAPAGGRTQPRPLCRSPGTSNAHSRLFHSVPTCSETPVFGDTLTTERSPSRSRAHQLVVTAPRG